MISIRKCSERRINVGNEDLRHVIFERRSHVLHRLQHFGRTEWLSGQIRRSLAGTPGVPIGHDDNHGLAASRRDQIVENEVRATLPDPTRLILSATMLEIEHRIVHLGLGVIVGRKIDERVPPRSRHLRVVPNLTHLSVGHILNRIVSRTWLRNLHCTRVLASAKKRMTVGIADFRTINDQCVIVQAGNKRSCGDSPESVRLLLHIHFRSTPEIQLYLCGVGSFHTNLHSSSAIDPGIFRSPDIGLGGTKIVGLLPPETYSKVRTVKRYSLQTASLDSPRKRLRFRPRGLMIR